MVGIKICQGTVQRGSKRLGTWFGLSVVGGGDTQ